MLTVPIRPSQLVVGVEVRAGDLLHLAGAWRRVVSTPPADPLTRQRIPDARLAVCERSWTLTLDPTESYEVAR